MSEIVDVIIHSCHGAYKGFKQTFVVIDRPLHFFYEHKGNCLVASDNGWYSSFYYERPVKNWQAFGGRKFDIPMKDGTVIRATGEWWDGKHQENAPEEIASVGMATIDQLNTCYVFSSGYVSKVKLDTWLNENAPCTVYDWYDTRRIEQELRRML
jgi:hypothetical protein